jgi:hypothetical protein
MHCDHALPQREYKLHSPCECGAPYEQTKKHSKHPNIVEIEANAKT